MKKRYFIIISLLIICLLAAMFLLFNENKESDFPDAEETVEITPFWMTDEGSPEYIRYNESQAFSYPRSYYIKDSNISALWNALDFNNWEISDESQGMGSEYLIFFEFHYAHKAYIILIDANDTAVLYEQKGQEYQMRQGTYNAVLSVLEEVKATIRNDCLILADQLLTSPENIICYTESLTEDQPLPGEAVVYDEEFEISYTDEDHFISIAGALNPMSWISTDMEDITFGGNSIRLVILQGNEGICLDIFEGDVVLADWHDGSLAGDYFLMPEGTYSAVLEAVTENK